MLPTAPLAPPTTIWTIGHSTRSIEEFLGLLAESRIEAIADVRSFPGSRKYPQYGREALAATLAAQAIGYHWLPALGGRRRVSPDSPNIAWRSDHVLGSGLVALPPLDDRRRAARARQRGRAHP